MFLDKMMKQWIVNKTLVRLYVNKNKKRMNIPCRIIQFDESKGHILIYHDDSKSTQTYSLSEIENIEDIHSVTNNSSVDCSIEINKNNTSDTFNELAVLKEPMIDNHSMIDRIVFLAKQIQPKDLEPIVKIMEIIVNQYRK
ncbi:hypothetical protein L1765_03770 [Microaerobacter geothermalis]|uniref:hypothetical protein n=1 Tax=Microaerobacter geothermalis TaxID=674972 RepID=UPI001F1B00CA|nr:hypothetical protein [Microaerobacter geothermalis]MCF6093112.1 hypothetical protein [Microaerobacter geothermalis]